MVFNFVNAREFLRTPAPCVRQAVVEPLRASAVDDEDLFKFCADAIAGDVRLHRPEASVSFVTHWRDAFQFGVFAGIPMGVAQRCGAAGSGAMGPACHRQERGL